MVTHDQEQSKLRSETISAFHEAVDENDNDGMFVLREKTKDDIEREEEDYHEYLRQEVGEDITDLITIEDEKNAPRRQDESDGKVGGAAPKSQKKQRHNNNGKMKEKSETDQEFLMK
jgi:protein KRI1